MPEVSWQVRDEGTAQVIQNFQRLTKEEKRAAIAASNVSGELSKVGRKSAGLKQVGKAALGIASALGATLSVSAAISASFAEVRRQIAETIQLAKEAQRIGQNVDNARGNILANDPNLNKADRAKIDAAIRNIAPQLGAAGAQQANKIFADVRTATPGATVDQQIAAFRTAVRGTALTGVDDLSQIAPQAGANVKLQQALTASGRKSSNTIAQNLLSTAGARAGIDTSQVASSLIPLIGREGATVEEKAALLGFGTAETAFSGERVGTGIGTLLSRLGRPGFKDTATGTAFNLKGGSKFGKLENLLDRIQGGELEQGAAIRAVAGENETLVPLLSSLLSKRGTFNETLSLARGSTKGGRNLQEETIATAIAEAPGLASTLRTRTAEGTGAIRQTGNIAGRSAADVAASISASRKGLGLGTPFLETLPFLGIEERAISAANQPGGLNAFEKSTQLADLSRAFGVEAPSGGGHGGGANPAAERFFRFGSAFRSGGEKGAFSAAVEEGFVSPEGGISGAERAALSSVGISDEQLNKLSATFQDGQIKVFTKLFAEVMAEARTLIADGQVGPKASDLEN